MATRRKSTVLATQRPKKNRLRFLGSPAVKKVLWYLFNLFFLAALVTMIACAVYGYSITDDLVERFEGKRWKIPSRVFSDALTLVPGASVEELSLLDRLKRLHYRKVGEETLEPGEYRVSGDTIDVFLHEFQYPWEKAEGYWLRIETHDGLITRLVDAAADRELPSAEIEPELIARFFGEHQEDRDLIRYVEVSPHLKNAIVTTEDQRFYRHWGFDPLGFTRAMLKNLVSLRFVQGGSTLTQQLVKNFYLTSERTITRKAKEAVMAFVLEMIYAKDAIFEAYMNEIYFAQEGSVSISGVGQASRYYFGRDVRTLGLAESALLAGLIRHPAGYNPVKRMERAKARRDYIIKRMLDAEMITPEEANEALAEDVKVLNRKPARTIAPYYIAFLKSQLDKRYGADILISEGLSIFTTLDVQAQKNAERAVDEGLAELESKYDRLKKGPEPVQAAMIAIQPQTGFIRAMVGGRDFYESQFNRITQARRQVGSVFKPFVYAAGFLRAYEDPAFSFTPATLVDDAPFTVTNPGSPPWTPHNYDGKYEGTVNARHALQKSRNVPTAKFAMEIGIDRIAGLAHRMGITSGLPEFPSLSLGSADLSPMEVASAYSTLANQGTHAEPLAIRDVVDANGRVLEKKPVEIERVVQPEVAYLTTSLMESVINHGTGARARALGFRHPAAGKTGTTNDYKDAWFVGFTPKILAAVWVGFDDNRELRLTGSAAALPIWTKFMISQLSKSVPVPFEVPERIVRRKIDPESGMLAGFDCPQFTEEVFLEGTEPEEECELHSDSVLDFFKKLGKPGGKQ